MIKTVSEFLELAASSDPACLDRIRTDYAEESIWFELISEHPSCVRTVTLNRNLPINVLDVLASHQDALVRTDVANRRSLSMELFRKLSCDPDESVRARIAWNKKAPREILEQLSDDECSIVFEVARRQLNKQ